MFSRQGYQEEIKFGILPGLNPGPSWGVARNLIPWAQLSTLDDGELETFQPPSDIIGNLAIPGIKFVFIDICKPSPFSSIVQMADSKILLNDIAHLRDVLISSYLKISQFSSGWIFSHDTVGDIVESQKIAVGFSSPGWISRREPYSTGQVSFVGVYFFDGVFGMTAVNRAIRQIVGIMHGSLGHGGARTKPLWVSTLACCLSP